MIEMCPSRHHAPGPASGTRLLLLLLVASAMATLSGFAIEITSGGKTYREVEVVAVEGDSVVLGTHRGDLTVSRKGLTWQLEAAVKAFESAGVAKPGAGASAELPPAASPKAWILGPVGSQQESGITVVSSGYFVAGEVSRSGKVTEPKQLKEGAPVFTGIVFVRDVKQKPASAFDRVLWRNGFADIDGQRLPAFTTADPGPVPVPAITDERVWTNKDNKELQASLRSIRDGIGQFVRADGKAFSYDLENLSAPDRALIREALLRHGKLLEQLKRDHPGQRLAEIVA